MKMRINKKRERNEEGIKRNKKNDGWKGIKGSKL
jgi:hypothetical protein